VSLCAFSAPLQLAHISHPHRFQAQSFFILQLWQMFHYSFSVSFVGTTGNCQLGFLPRFFSVQFVPSDLFGGVLILPEIPPTEEDKKDKKRSHWDFYTIY
jgi:hypothetical protein